MVNYKITTLSKNSKLVIVTITLLALELKELFVINSQFSEKEESRLFTKEADLTFHKNKKYKHANIQIYK